jgi:hypothetical protein
MQPATATDLATRCGEWSFFPAPAGKIDQSIAAVGVGCSLRRND